MDIDIFMDILENIDTDILENINIDKLGILQNIDKYLAYWTPMHCSGVT